MKWNVVTWYSKLLALALFVALPFIGFYYGNQYGQALQANTDVVTNSNIEAANQKIDGLPEYYTNVSEWQTDTRDDANVSIAYPLDFTPTDIHNERDANWRNTDPGNNALGFTVLTLTVPKPFQPQTNFSEAVFKIGRSTDPKAVQSCTTVSESSGEISSGTKNINGIQFATFKQTGAAAGNIYDGTSYRTVHGGQCYAVEYLIHSTQIANYPAEYHLHPFDEAKVASLLERIVGTFQFLK